MGPADFIHILSEDHVPIYPVGRQLTQVAVTNFQNAKDVFTHVPQVTSIICLKDNGTWTVVSNVKDAEEFYEHHDS